MRFASAVSRLVDGVDAAEAILHALRAGGCSNPDFLALFITGHHRESAALISDHIRMELEPGTLIGCTCEGVIGADEEIEREPGVSALAANLPGVKIDGFQISPQDWNDALASEEVMETLLGRPPSGRGCVLLADPFSTPIDELLSALDRQPGIGPVFGGMASGAYQPGGNALFLNDELYTEGCVGAIFSGPLRVHTVVSQGCRPIGERYLVTGAVQNLITSLGNRPALEVAREVLERIRDDERSVGSELFLGIAMSEYQDEFHRGDFLVRNMIGADPRTGAIAVGDAVRSGQTVQFHVRDAEAADEDLRALIAPTADLAPAGALLFSCNGRGTRMFDQPCHDIGAALELLPGLQAAGFFAMGELGPVGGKSYIHGHTASFAFFSPSTEEDL